MPTSSFDRDRISAFLNGQLSRDDAELLIKQIESDAKLQAALRELEALCEDKNLVQRLREIFPVSEIADEAFLEEALAQATALNGTGKTVVQTGTSDSSAGSFAVETGVAPTTPFLKLPVVESDAEPKQLREYTLLEKLGEGGMGAVYKALHTRLHKIVALKLLSERRLKNTEIVERFSREMKAVGKLDHPNIVRATDAGEFNGVHYLVMEYVQGRDLNAVIAKRGPLPVAEACELIRQAAVGLQHASEHGLVHRDLKPANLMLTDERKIASSNDTRRDLCQDPTAVVEEAQTAQRAVVKILDFGLARLRSEDDANDLTSEDQVMGTLDYMAPEQAIDTHNVDIRGDIYSLGCTMYKLLTGRAPFGAPEFPTAAAKLFAHATQNFEPVTTFRKDIPSPLSEILNRALAKNKKDRFPTPIKLAEALAPFCRGADLARLLSDDAGGPSHSAVQSNYAPTTNSPPSRRRGWKVAAGFAAFGAMLMCGIIILLKVTDDKGQQLEVTVKVPEDTRSISVDLEGAKDRQKIDASSAPSAPRLPPTSTEEPPSPTPQIDVVLPPISR